MKIYKPSLETFLSEAKEKEVYLITTLEKGGQNWLDHFIVVTGFNEKQHVLEYRWQVYSHLTMDTAEAKLAFEKAASAEAQVAERITQAGFEVRMGIINPEKPVSGNPFMTRKKEAVNG